MHNNHLLIEYVYPSFSLATKFLFRYTHVTSADFSYPT